MVRQKERQKPDSVKVFGGVFRLVAALAVIFGAGFCIVQFVDWRIEDAINEEQFIRKVASHVRPYVIFDANEAILVDGGAMQYLEGISVQKSEPWDTGCHLHIVITPKEHLSYAPLLDYLSSGRLLETPTPKRGPGHKWIYEFRVVQWEKGAGKPMLFRVEIMQ